MEQIANDHSPNELNYSLITLVTLLMLLSLAVMGCSPNDPSPELKDPIYKSLQTEVSKYKAEVESNKKALVDLEKELKKASERSMERRVIIKDIQRTKKRIHSAKQALEYYQIRVARRRAEDRVNYRLSRETGMEWPDPKEQQYFTIHQRLKDPTLRIETKERLPTATK